jgi:radical SAM PhpK family P-methyltransferase
VPKATVLDCVVIGYNEPPFSSYERLLRNYGEDSEAYRDLRYSFVEVGSERLNFIDLLNHVDRLANPAGGAAAERRFESGEIPNLAAAYLTNFLRRRHLHARYINLFQREQDQLRALLAQKPLCVAITTTFYVLNFPVTEMVEFIRRHDPDTKIVVGGPLVGNHLRNTKEEGEPLIEIDGIVRNQRLCAALEDIGADVYVTDSQGELTLAHLIEELRAGHGLRRVPNLIYADRGIYRRTLAVAETNPMDEVYIDWPNLADRDLGPTLQTRTARSCAFSCAFCNYPERAGSLSLASVATVEAELDGMSRIGDVRNVVFIDDTFNVPLARFKEICRLMIAKRYGFRWFSYFRCSNADEEAFDLMAESGCTGVFLGIESGSPTILKGMHKAAKVEQYVNGIAALRQRGILTFGSFIIGFPGETAETVRETLDFITTTRMDYYRTQMWYYERGTPIDRQRDEYRIEGDGFVWSHATMDSMTAMDHIERMFFTIHDSTWLPQWSFDFWIIPYLIGKGLSLDQFRSFMTSAHSMLATDMASMPPQQKLHRKQESLHAAVAAARQWARAAPEPGGTVLTTL